MSDPNTATIRTVVNAGVLVVLAYLVSLAGHDISTDDPRLIIIAPIVVGVFYRLSKVISETVPWVGYVLFGVNRSPSYTLPPPAVPPLADTPPA